MDYSDQTLIQETQAGSNIAFELLMKRYERLVFKVAFGFTKNRESALDVTQNVFLKVHRNLEACKRRSRFKNWLIRISVNESLNWLRSQKRHNAQLQPEGLESSFPSSHLTPEDLVLHSQRRAQLLTCLFSLNPRHRLAVILRYFEEMPLREIASVLRCSEGVVKSILFRSLRSLKERMSTEMEFGHERL